MVSVQVAVMVTSPSATATTWPFSSTVAIFSSLEVQVTVGWVVCSGSTVAVRSVSSPMIRVASVGVTATPVAGTGATFTLTVAVTSLPSSSFSAQVRVIVASPSPTAS